MRARPSRHLGTLCLLLSLGGCATDPEPTDDAQPDDVVDPVRSVRRLAAREVRYAMEDVLEVATDPVAFPADQRVAGFDNHQDGTDASDLFLEKVQELARDAAIAWTDQAMGPRRQIDPEQWPAEHGCKVENSEGEKEFWVLWLNAPVNGTVTVDEPGDYTLTFQAYNRHSFEGPTRTSLAVSVDGALIWQRDLADDQAPVVVERQLTWESGEHAIRLQNPDGLDDDSVYFEGPAALRGPCHMVHAAAIGRMVLSGPTPTAWPCGDADDACVIDQVADVAAKAWRRPVDEVEKARLATVYQAGMADTGSQRFAAELALQAVFLSPHFLFVVDQTEPESDVLSQASLATRLALFLWSSLPDETLRACVDEGRLGEPEGTCSLAGQAARMRQDPRFTRAMTDFIDQWLDLDVLDLAELPGMDAEAATGLLSDMREETRTTLLAALQDPSGSTLGVLDAPSTWVTDRLADFYGLTPQGRSGFYELDASAAGRSGLLTQGSMLAMTSIGGRTSPVKRGVWVLSNLACDPPGAAPANIPPLPEGTVTPTDMAAALEAHRQNPACAQCHDSIDPVGLALEAFGPDTLPRDVPALTLAMPDGTELSDLTTLHAWLVADDRFHRCVTSQLATWGLGTTVKPTVALTSALAGKGDTWQAIVDAVIASEAFTRRTEESK